jgi:hypothetical protein
MFTGMLPAAAEMGYKKLGFKPATGMTERHPATMGLRTVSWKERPVLDNVTIDCISCLQKWRCQLR